MASQPEANQSPVELVNFCPSPPAPVSRRSARNSATPQHRLPCPRACTGKTPGQGISLDNPHPEFVERCAACDGMFPSAKHDPMKKDQRMKCSVCKRKTSNFCWKCRRYLCNEPPLNGVGRDGTKFPKMFCVKVPMLKEDGSLQRDPENNAIFCTEQGVLSCYIIAHQEKWKPIYKERKVTAAVSAETSEESNVVVKRDRRSV